MLFGIQRVINIFFTELYHLHDNMCFFSQFIIKSMNHTSLFCKKVHICMYVIFTCDVNMENCKICQILKFKNVTMSKEKIEISYCISWICTSIICKYFNDLKWNIFSNKEKTQEVSLGSSVSAPTLFIRISLWSNSTLPAPNTFAFGGGVKTSHLLY